MVNERRRELWQLDRRQVTVMVVGAIVYGLVWGLTRALNLPNLLFAAINPAVAVLVVIGLVWGPLVGFVVGFVGTFLGDFLISDLTYPLYWDFSIGLMGLVAGLGAWFYHRPGPAWRRYLLAEIWGLVTVFAGAFITTMAQIMFIGLTEAGEASFWPAVQSDSVNVIIFVPLVLWLVERFGPAHRS